MCFRKTILTFIFLGLLLSVGGVSGYAQVLTEADPETGQVDPGKEFTLYYKMMSVLLDGQYFGNQNKLNEMSSFFQNDEGRDTLYITVYCSIEDTYEKNARLATKRSKAVLDYLERNYSISDRYDIRVKQVAEDWTELRRLAEASDMPYRQAVLDIIDTVDVFHGREKDLMKLAGGEPYTYMQKEIFPWLRRVEIRVAGRQDRVEVPDTARVVLPAARPFPAKDTCVCPGSECTPLEIGKGQAKDEVRAVEYKYIGSVPLLPERKSGDSGKERPFLFALKTDLVRWAGIRPGFETATFMPNLALEFYFSDRWSVNASAVYSHWNAFSGRDKLFAVAAFDGGGRFWFSGKGTFRGFYAGAYGSAGSFNKYEDADAARTGTFWGLGLGVGYMQPLSRHWALEVEARGMYIDSRTDHYNREGAFNYYDYTKSENKILPSVRLNLVYRR